MNAANITALKHYSKQTTRKPTAVVSVVWAGKSVETAEVADTTSKNYVSYPEETIVGIGTKGRWFFTDTGSQTSAAILDGTYCAMPNVAMTSFLVGWWGRDLSGSTGAFGTAQSIRINFAPQPVGSAVVRGYLTDDNSAKEYPVDFSVKIYNGSEAVETKSITGNTSTVCEVLFDTFRSDITSLELIVTRWSNEQAFVKITGLFDEFGGGYMDDDIVSMSFLEETCGVSGSLPIGNISSNQITVSLQNIEDDFFIGNIDSKIGGMTKPSRRIEPAIGFYRIADNGAITNEKILMPRGLFWSGDWTVSDDSGVASTTGLDRLGLLQDVEYRGLGNIGDPNADAETCVWQNARLTDVIMDILEDLRNNFMQDLVYSVEDIGGDSIELVFFKKQSYFEVFRQIAEAGFASIYMDAPTEEEIAEAAERGIRCVDVLRVKNMEKFYTGGDIGAVVEYITKDDYINKSINTRRDELANSIFVKSDRYELDSEGKPVSRDMVFVANRRDEEKILEYGLIEYNFPDNQLIQGESAAQEMAEKVLRVFGCAPRFAELTTFGDVTTRIGDVWIVPEYAKKDLNTMGTYVVTRMNTEYDGSLRQTVSLRLANDEMFIIDEIGAAQLEIDESGDRTDTIYEMGGQ